MSGGQWRAAVVAAVAQDEPAQMQQLEMQQQHLPNKVVNMLHLRQRQLSLDLQQHMLSCMTVRRSDSQTALSHDLVHRNEQYDGDSESGHIKHNRERPYEGHHHEQKDSIYGHSRAPAIKCCAGACSSGQCKLYVTYEGCCYLPAAPYAASAECHTMMGWPQAKAQRAQNWWAQAADVLGQ